MESTKLPFLDMVKDGCNLVLFLAHVKYSTELYFITELVTQEQLCNWKINNATVWSDYESFVNCNMDCNMLYLLLSAIFILLFLKMPWQNWYMHSIIIIACYAYKQWIIIIQQWSKRWLWVYAAQPPQPFANWHALHKSARISVLHILLDNWDKLHCQSLWSSTNRYLEHLSNVFT
jgi:hypothetical protein